MIAPRRPYQELAAEFRWQVPEEFNFGALIDAWATDRSRVALYWEDEAGRRASPAIGRSGPSAAVST